MKNYFKSQVNGRFERKLAVAVFLLAGTFHSVQAANVSLIAGDGVGNSSFTNGADWGNGAIPNTGNDYYTATFGLRTPGDGSNYKFGGHSLTLQPGTTTGYSLIYKGTASANLYTLNNFTNSGGFIRSGAGSQNTCNLGGNMVVAGDSTIQADQSPFIISANLSGSGILTNLNPAPQTYGTITYSGTNSAFAGELLAGNNGILIFSNTNSVPGNPSSPNPGQITLGSSSTLEDLAGVTFGNANGGITLSGSATINVSGSNTVTTVAEPISGGNVAMIKTGTGSLYVNAADSCTGTTTVSAGTLAGSGSFNGPVTISSAGNLGLGSRGAGVGTLTINNNLTLQGNVTVRINNTGALAANDQVIVNGNVAYGGILTITNISSDGTPLTNGNTFQVFNVSGTSSGNFSTTIVGSPGASLSYVFNPANGVLSVVLTSSLQGTLAHEYSFFSEPDGSLTATDLVAGANGTLQGSAAITGGQLVLDGTSACYANLPGGLITGDSAVSIEAWADYGNLPANCYLFSFGNTDGSGNGENYIFCAPQFARITISGIDPGNSAEQNATCNGWSGQTNLHVVAIYNPAGLSLAIYTNGVLAALNNSVTTSLTAVSNVLSYLGRSLYASDPYTPINVDEFRIWNGVLNSQQIALDAASGPTQIITNVGALQSVFLNLTNQMIVGRAYGFVPGGTAPAVANLLSHGGTQQATLVGDFANVSNVNLNTYGPPTFTSGNTGVLTVNASGSVTAVATGTTTIIANYGGLSATQTVTAIFATNTFIFDSFGDGFWNIINQGNNNALVARSGSSTQETPTNGSTEQQFEILYNEQNNTFRIRQQSSWLCITAKGSNPSLGAGVTTFPTYTGAAWQQWNLMDAGNGYFRIANAAMNLVLQTDNGMPSNVTLAQSNSSPYQLWKFVYQNHFPKKGSAGYEGSPYQGELTTEWAYNYDDHTSASEPNYFSFEPMVWGQYWEPVSDLQSRDPGWLATPQPLCLMTFNEPDNSSQANMSTNTAIAMWPSLQALNVPLVGPGTQNTEDAWENNFYKLITSHGYRADYAAIHEYVPPSASSLISDCQAVYNAYGRPVWLTEFSPVDWSSCKCWSEDDDYNFLAEFMWQVENLPWFRRYSIFPFSNTNTNGPWVDNGFTGSVFLSDGQTLSPYGELYATWDGDETLRTQIPYIIHNLGTSFRLTATNTAGTPLASDIYIRNATTEWTLLQAADGNYYIISLNDGRRLRDVSGSLSLAPVGTTGSAVEWTFTGPNSLGYYYIGNPSAGNNLSGSGTPPAIAFGLASSSTQTSATEWRLVKPYQPVTINTNNAMPAIVSAIAGSRSAALNWTGGGGAPYFNVYRSNVSGGGYALIASALTQNSYTDNAVTNGLTYYYVVTAMNILGLESTNSNEVNVTPVSLVSTNITFSMTSGNTLQLSWPNDHTGWTLQVQTNDLNAGLGTNWQDVAGSSLTNQISIPMNPASGAVFYRLVYP